MAQNNRICTYEYFERRGSQQRLTEINQSRKISPAPSLARAYRGLDAKGKFAVWVAAGLLPVAIIGLVDRAHYDAITALGSLAAAIAAAAAAFIAVRGLQSSIEQARKEMDHQYLALSAELMMGMEDRFNSQEMLKLRKDAAKFLLNSNAGNAEKATGLSALYDVLGFFQTVSNLARRGALDRGFVWDQYYLWMHMYWQLAVKPLQTTIAENPLFWRDLRELLEDFHEFDNFVAVCNGRKPEGPRPEDELRIFLRRELERGGSGG